MCYDTFAPPVSSGCICGFTPGDFVDVAASWRSSPDVTEDVQVNKSRAVHVLF